MPTTCAPRLELFALGQLPIFRPGDDLGRAIVEGLAGEGLILGHGDVLVVASKAVSRAEGRFVDLSSVEVSDRAREVAGETGKDARMVELVLRESASISRVGRDALVVRHRLGFVSADAGIDMSNANPPTGWSAPGEPAHLAGGPWVLLLPEDPDRSAEALRRAVSDATGARVGVVISDSFGRPFRLGTVGAAIGVAGMPALWDKRGEPDLFDRRLEHTQTALADQVAAAADLVAGQGSEGRAVVVVRGLSFDIGEHGAHELVRPRDKDLYA
jgi:coenzyme F420-0:L-glutamate ligase / coenzyme F420-1:gamma-L-glutamate ligase